MTTPFASPLSPDLALAVRLAREAGAAIEAVRAVGFSAHDKADTSPVTEADLAADRLIRRVLTIERPDDALLSEESTGAPPRSDQALWCVDPLDGTEAFVDGGAAGADYVRGYAVQIARLVPDGDRYRLQLGVTYEPRADELFFAERGRGLFRVARGELSGPLTMPEHTRQPTLVTSKRVEPETKSRFIANGYLDGGALRSVGVKVGRLVLGEADVYLATHRLSWWDLAAPQIILEEAGGQVADLSGDAPPFRFADLSRPVFRGPFVMARPERLGPALAVMRA
ncbi:MAG TPA: inositol monophosphatase family protein [Myxococcota bacterium]|nr:inositol monophosphatase family protein [Myxococcota bacterium]